MPSSARHLVFALCCLGAVQIRAAGGRGTVDLTGVAQAGGRPEPSAVIWLDAPEAPSSRARSTLVLTQRNLAFLPRVLAVRTGTTVAFPNEDRVFHNVFSFHDNQKFDLGTYPVGAQKRVVFATPGVSRLLCNIHPHMAGYVVAVNSPYFATAHADGSFSIDAVPPGTYPYHAWRPTGPELTFDSPMPFPWGDEGELHDLWLGGRHTVGGRVRLPAGFTAQMALIRQSGDMAEYSRGSVLDLSLTYSVRRH